MEFLNKAATIVFVQLVDSMNGQQHRKIINEPFMPLTIEQIGPRIETPWGDAVLYSLAHYYEQNGDLMQDPEMCFFILDKRDGFAKDWEKVRIAPCMYQQANLGVYQESVRMENYKLTKFNQKLQAEHTAFANGRLFNIRQQGFLNR